MRPFRLTLGWIVLSEPAPFELALCAVTLWPMASVDLHAYEARVAPLRAILSSATLPKQQRSKIRVEHGQYLAQVAVQALNELPREPD